MGEHVLGPCHVPLCSLGQPAGSGWVALLLPLHRASPPSGMASLGTGMPGQRPPAGDGSAATQGCSPGTCSGSDPGLRLGLGCQQEGLATQAQEGSHDLANICQAVRALLSPWQRVWA